MKSDKTHIEYWKSLIEEDQRAVDEAVDQKEIANTLVATLLTFMVGEGDKVLKDSEWMTYIINDIHSAVNSKMIELDADSKKRLQKIEKMHFGDEDDEEF